MTTNSIWQTSDSFTILELSYLLADMEPAPPSDEMPPVVRLTMKNTLRALRFGHPAPFRGPFLDRHAMKPKPFGSGYFLNACDEILVHDKPIRPDFFDNFRMTRPEAMGLAEALGLRPVWLFRDKPKKKSRYSPEEERCLQIAANLKRGNPSITRQQAARHPDMVAAWRPTNQTEGTLMRLIAPIINPERKPGRPKGCKAPQK